MALLTCEKTAIDTVVLAASSVLHVGCCLLGLLIEQNISSFMNDKEKIDAAPSAGNPSRVKVFLIACAAIVLVFVAIGPMAFSSDWVSSSDFHACIEISSSFIAMIAAAVCLTYYFGLESRYFLIIGLGFFVCGSEDLIHGIFGFKRLFAESGVDFSRFIPGTYVAGRSVLALMIIAAALLETRLKRAQNLRHQAVVFSSITLAAGGGATALAFMLPLPKFVYPELAISRPVDFVSALLFLVAFVLILKRFRVRQDIFSGSLLACILLNIGGQVYMSFSKQLFDVFFDIAHLANILSYCIPVLGIVVQGLEEMKSSRQELLLRRQAQRQLQTNEQELRAANEQLQFEVADRKKAETEAIEIQENFKTILAQSPFGVVVIGRDRTIRWANEYTRVLAGVEDPDTLCGRGCEECLCPAQQKACPILDKGQRVDNSEQVLRRHDGREIPILKTVTEIEMNGEPVLLETFVDVTEYKRAKEELTAKMKEFEGFNKLAVGRELRMIELKEEVNRLLAEIGKDVKYEIVK